MKTLFIKKSFLIVLSIIIAAGTVCGLCAGFAAKHASAVNPNMPTVVIDAGHGGIDNGVQGIKTKTGAGSLFIRVLVEVPMKVKHEKKLMEEALKNFDVKNYDKAKKYADNMSALYGVNPYNHKK